jgi:hypothetical protein
MPINSDLKSVVSGSVASLADIRKLREQAREVLTSENDKLEKQISSILNFKISTTIQNTLQNEHIQISYTMYFCIIKGVLELNFESLRLFCATR